MNEPTRAVDMVTEHPRGGCRTCSGFGHWAATIQGKHFAFRSIGGTVWCERRKFINALPLSGCSQWEREIGTDDE
ncbi:MAG: hypothetical protein ACRDAM_13860 [Casimicrobium sp.]